MDDIVTRLRGGKEKLSPAECWGCGEWGCKNNAGAYIPCWCEEKCDCDNSCGCNCHSWYGIVGEAADEIEQLREFRDLLAAQLVDARAEQSRLERELARLSG